jgi:hypothetical protein
MATSNVDANEVCTFTIDTTDSSGKGIINNEILSWSTDRDGRTVVDKKYIKEMLHNLRRQSKSPGRTESSA